MMTSHGKAETQKLIENLENQLERLVNQLQDLEECREEMDNSEYLETKQDTMEQMRELNESLERLSSGNLSLISTFSAMRLALCAAISEAFKTPEVIRMFGKRQPQQLRERLEQVEEKFRLNKISNEQKNREKAEILLALQQLQDNLTAEELKFLDEQNSVKISFMEELPNED
ncbi:protein LZIC-like [Ctenocephalides felis]|uniref:protein LZIC-like n=1 Tax=Ctenocephalides felis TaxID=7515 RepID=UPI000E6E4F0A|nr:protein LZIC-like [Ctenocephalides felis]XP_026465463.1 protein LZIC-like [Ctenocephalides felis]